MAFELFSATAISAFYGSSLFVWGSVLGLTLTGLSIGYYWGGHLYQKTKNLDYLFINLAIGAILIGLMPKIAAEVMNFTSSFGLRIGVFTSSIVLLVLPLMFIGTTTSILIGRITEDIDLSGNHAGNIYASSSIGGIAMGLLCGFWIIPMFGLGKPALIIASITTAICVVYFFKSKKRKHIIAILLAFTITASFNPAHSKKSVAKLKYQTEGILGQVSVLDVRDLKKNKTKRRLFINNISQSMVQVGYEPLSLLHYVHRIGVLSSIKPPGSKALIIGYGGGNIAYELLSLGFTVDAVELDRNVIEAANQYFFNHNGACNITIDDSRHFVKTTQNKYDVIIMDISTGEIQSSYNYTVESMNEFQQILEKDGLLIVNYLGYLRGEKGLATRSVLKTLNKSGFQTNLWKNDNKSLSDILFVASMANLNFNQLSEDRINDCCKGQGFTVNPLLKIDELNLDMDNSYILEDNKPLLENIALPVSEEARMTNINTFINKKIKVEIPIIN